MKTNYEWRLIASYFQNACQVWKNDSQWILRLAQVAETYSAEFGLKYEFPSTVKSTASSSGKKKPGKKTPRTKLTIANVKQLEDYFARVVQRLEKETATEEHAFLDKFLEHLEFDEIDRKICEILLLSANQAFKLFFADLDGLKNPPTSLELISAFLGQDKRIVHPHLKLESPLLNSGIVYQQSRDYEGDPIYDTITYHLHGKVIEGIDNGEFDITKATDRVIGKAVLPETEWEDFEHIRAEAEFAAKILGNGVRQRVAGINILVHGDTGTGKTEFCKTLADHLGVPLYAVGEKAESEEEDFGDHRKPEIWSPAARLADKRLVENMLGRRSTQAVTMFDEMEDVLRSEQIKSAGGRHSASQMSKSATNNLLTQNEIPCLWTTNNIERFDPAMLRRFSYAIELKTPDAAGRQRVIMRALQRCGKSLGVPEVKKLADNHAVPPAFFSNAVAAASLAAGDNEKDFLPGLHLGLRSIGRIVTGRREAKSPRPVEQYDLGLVNADQDLNRLTEKIAAGNHRNFSVCGYGVSGAGKSEYLVYLAHKMGLEALVVPYSDVGSAYHSETEQNIRMKFEQAADEAKFLIFDEADSLLADRRGAHQNWERTIVNEMLTRMERHEFPLGCTTNLMDEIDPASLRRFVFKIRFNGLTEQQSREAYRIYFKHDLPEGVVLPDVIAPGDFANVLKQARILDTLNDPESLVKDLQRECENKNLRRPIGFIAPSNNGRSP